LHGHKHLIENLWKR